jgi:hypothetical protein
MTIQEAAKKAGPGGKIRSADFAEGAYVLINEDRLCAMKYVWSGGIGKKEDYAPSIEGLSRTDWEVVEDKPVIEVGDVVKMTGDGFNMFEVIEINYKGGVRLRDITQHCVHIDNLTLIRKGTKKWTIPGVTGYDLEKQTIIDDYALELAAKIKGAKTYTLDITEEAE